MILFLLLILILYCIIRIGDNISVKYLWDMDLPVTYYSSVDSVLNYIENNKINSFFIANNHNSGDNILTKSSFLFMLEERSNQNSFDIVYTDKQHPAFSYNGENDNIYINLYFKR